MTETPSHIRPPSQAGLARRVFHTLIALAGWVVFVYWWTIVVKRVSAHEVRFTVLFVLASLVICIAVTGLWVLHNRSIFRRKGPRTGVRETALDYSRDPLGRAVTFDGAPERFLTAPVVRVRLDHDTKSYRPMSADSTRAPRA